MSTIYELPLCVIFSIFFLLLLRLKHSQHPVLKHPKFMFFPQGETKSHTDTKQQVIYIKWSSYWLLLRVAFWLDASVLEEHSENATTQKMNRESLKFYK
jgi:hypothetical protein